MAAHHLDPLTVMRYVHGDLDPAFAIVVASHLAMCDTCRNVVRDAEEVGGLMLAENAPTALAPEAFNRILSRIDEGAVVHHPPETVKAKAAADSPIPLPLQRFVGSRFDNIRWRTIVPGIRKHTIRLDQTSKSSLYMLQISAGKAVPEHGHGGQEMTLVLSGAYRDELGRFGPGDIADLDNDLEHQPIVESGVPCICLVATEQPTRFKGIISRMLQPIARI